MGMNWKIFDGVVDLFKSWEDSSTKDKEFDSSIRKLSFDRKTKEKILSRLLEESQGIICRDTNAADSQNFLLG
jgi:hypothetical protein